MTRQFQGETIMCAFLVTIAVWLSSNFGLDGVHECPHIEFLLAERVSEIWYARVAGAESIDRGVGASQSKPSEIMHDIHAFYEDDSRTIYLEEGWAGSSIAERSVLVHEMVHHLQSVAGHEYDCPAAREQLAYRAQAEWLELNGRSLQSEFGLDPLTLLVRTNCLY